MNESTKLRDLWHITRPTLVQQESLANSKVSARQRFVYVGP